MWKWVVLAICLALSGISYAGPLEDANAATARGDFKKAVEIIRPLAGQGNASAQYSLGDMYIYGAGVPQDFAEAVKWYRKAAEQGNARAQHDLGFMYDQGRGVPQDYTEAVKWYRKAAEQGDASAQYSLGEMYVNGQGVPQAYVQAHKWFNLAAVNGNAAAVNNRDAIAAKMTPAQIAEAQNLAREWKPTK